jgi:hypothetical protein
MTGWEKLPHNAGMIFFQLVQFGVIALVGGVEIQHTL